MNSISLLRYNRITKHGPIPIAEADDFGLPESALGLQRPARVGPLRGGQMRKVLLTPIGLWWEENDKAIVIFIRDPKTEEIVDEAVTSAALADKTGMSQEKARQIFQEAYAALERRMGGRSRGAGEQGRRRTGRGGDQATR